MQTRWVEAYYHCQAKIFAVGHKTEISEVSDNHLAGYSNINVTSIDFSNQVVRLAPTNLEEFFPNLALYQLYNTQTEVIHPNETNKLPELKYYMNQANPKLTKIPPNMFADNLKLVGIAFNVGDHQIQHVAYNVFDHLDHLTMLLIDGICLNFAARSRVAVVASLFNVFKACPPTLDMLNEQLSQRDCNCWGRE